MEGPRDRADAGVRPLAAARLAASGRAGPTARVVGSGAAGGWTPTPTRKTNPWAVVALVTGILPLFPVAIASGIVALVQIRKRGEDGAPMAIIGLVAGGLWTLLIGFGLIAAFVFGGFESGSQGRVGNAGSTTVGDCLSAPAPNQRRSPVVDCRYTHRAEVYEVEALGAGPWPGSDELVERADRVCDAAFEPYVGQSYITSDYDYGFYLPDELEWSSGERRVVCVILPSFDDELRGTVRDGGQAPATSPERGGTAAPRT